MIRLRPAEPQDDWIFYNLRREIQPDLSREEHEQWFSNHWEHRFVAYDGPAFVGVIRISPVVDDRNGRLSLQVCKKEQKKGLGTQMLARIQKVAADLGFESLYGEIRLGNGASQRAFERAGFEPTRYEVKL
jgi:RimJ/RimL family protein N-acetyltransferase